MDVRSDNLKTLLIQGLHGQDKALLDQTLCETDHRIIDKCVARLPSAYAVTFLVQVVTERLQMKPNKGPVLLPWIKSVLQHHATAIMNTPDIGTKLGGLIEALELRTQSHQRLLALSGKMDLVLSQIANKQNVKKNAQDMEPVQTYEESEEEEDKEENEDQIESQVEEEVDENMEENEEEDETDVSMNGDAQENGILDSDQDDSDEDDEEDSDDESDEDNEDDEDEDESDYE